MRGAQRRSNPRVIGLSASTGGLLRRRNAPTICRDVRHPPCSLRRGRAGIPSPRPRKSEGSGAPGGAPWCCVSTTRMANADHLNARRAHRTPRLPALRWRLFFSAGRASHDPFHGTDPSQLLARRCRLGGAPNRRRPGLRDPSAGPHQQTRRSTTGRALGRISSPPLPVRSAE